MIAVSRHSIAFYDYYLFIYLFTYLVCKKKKFNPTA